MFVNVFPPRPVSRPVMFQSWNTLTFLHWPYDPQILRGLLPADLELDVFDGSAWIGITAFKVVNLHPPGLPALPWVSSFPETNVRTYVRGRGGEPGIWFFTLEADRLLAVLGARAVYGLPYRWAHMRVARSGDTVRYTSHRHRFWRPAHSRIRVRIGEPVRTGELEAFLTARFRLYTFLYGKLASADVEHEPWPLYSPQLVEIEQNLLEGSGVPQATGQPIVHFSPGVQVRVGGPERG